MKKKILLICSFLVLTIMLAAPSTRAQTIGSYDAEIPFGFTIGDESFEAGDYKFKLKSPNYLATVLTVSDSEGLVLQTTALTRNGDRSGDDEATLAFNLDGDHYVLNKIVAPRFGFTAPRSKVVITVYVKGDPKPKSDTVSIVLKRQR